MAAAGGDGPSRGGAKGSRMAGGRAAGEASCSRGARGELRVSRSQAIADFMLPQLNKCRHAVANCELAANRVQSTHPPTPCLCATTHQHRHHGGEAQPITAAAARRSLLGPSPARRQHMPPMALPPPRGGCCWVKGQARVVVSARGVVIDIPPTPMAAAGSACAAIGAVAAAAVVVGRPVGSAMGRVLPGQRSRQPPHGLPAGCEVGGGGDRQGEGRGGRATCQKQQL